MLVKKIEVPANILKHLFGSKSLYRCVKNFYDFETLLVKLDDAELKLEELRKICIGCSLF